MEVNSRVSKRQGDKKKKTVGGGGGGGGRGRRWWGRAVTDNIVVLGLPQGQTTWMGGGGREGLRHKGKEMGKFTVQPEAQRFIRWKDGEMEKEV